MNVLGKDRNRNGGASKMKTTASKSPSSFRQMPSVQHRNLNHASGSVMHVDEMMSQDV